ncbi:hypothetical protein Vadar_017132 [Vaccinium darrowii]|uniref:Uncharacterized protein n=1 Tax=Vaccinium darrowii TaxID=229202 RepID=A0ACB7Y8J5_9ERIC|nr:hypothetical protein Vadar_017132 [Vaccinium darrowii]
MAMEEEEKKRKTMTSEGDNYDSRSGDGRLFPPPELPHDWVAAEILTRLPVKSLMRFKCVSKLWLSTILDPGFCEAHRARAGPHCLTSLVIVSPDHHRRRLLRRRGDDDEEEYPNQQQGLGLGFFLATPSRRDRDVGPGSYVFDLLRHQFTLSTREYDGVTEHLHLELPPPPEVVLEENVGAAANAILYKYYIGFDYLIMKSKVLRVCSIQGALFCISQCDILTLGGEAESWRRLHAAPPIHIIGGGGAEGKENSVYIDGERHWWHSSGCFLVSFCFTDEEFQLIDLPPGLPELGGSLHEFRGRLALVTGVKNRKLRMWLLGWSDDDEEGGEYEYEYEWSKHSLRIPYAFADHGCCLLGNLPPGLMLLTGPSTPIEQLENQDQRQQPEEEEQVNNSESPRKATPPIFSLDLSVMGLMNL